MPLPLAPIAATALRVGLRYGTVALATYAMARAAERGRRDQRAEDAFDETPEGLTLRSEPGQTNLTGRFRRIVRLGKAGPGVEIDATALGRFNLRRL
jgi:hypothetical protein